MGPKIEAKVETKIQARPTEVNHKVAIHLGCIVFGIILTVAATWLPSDWTVVHFGGLFAGIPLVIQEILDWIKKL